MKFKIIIILSFFAVSLNAQTLPKVFSIDETNQTIDENPAGNGITDIVITGDTIWLGTGSGLSRSTDKGVTWKNYFGSEVFGKEDISALDYNNGLIWSATAHTVERDRQFLPEGSGLKFSTDNGETWSSVPQPVDAPSDSIVEYGINNIRALPVTVAINNITYDAAVTSREVWIASYAGGARKSSDFGQTWQRVVLPPDHLDSINSIDTLKFSLQPVRGNFGNESYLNHRVFSVVSVNDSAIFIGTAGGINKTTDGGKSWVKFNHTNQLNPISGNFVVALAYNENNNTIWAATWKAEGQSEFYGVSSSSDFGQTWQTFLEGEKINNFGFKGNDVIAASDNGIFRSSNNGETWVKPTSIVDSKTQILLRTNTFYSAASLGNEIWLGSNDGLVKLNEGNSMWQGEWEVFIASQKIASKNETYAFPNPFTPQSEVLKIKYSTGGESRKVTIRIFDFDMNLVKTVIQNAERGDPVHQIENNNPELNGVIDHWDGKDESGNYVPNGVYFYRIDFDGGDALYGKILVLM